VEPGIRVVAFCAWLLVWRAFGGDKLFFMASVFLLMMTNLGKTDGGLSAYSVFNPGQRHLLGEFRAEHVEQMVRNPQGAPPAREMDQDGDVVGVEETEPQAPEIKSKEANKAFKSGSGRKLKHCCGAPPGRKERRERQELTASERTPVNVQMQKPDWLDVVHEG
jgi:hypothetical protein